MYRSDWRKVALVIKDTPWPHDDRGAFRKIKLFCEVSFQQQYAQVLRVYSFTCHFHPKEITMPWRIRMNLEMHFQYEARPQIVLYFEGTLKLTEKPLACLSKIPQLSTPFKPQKIKKEMPYTSGADFIFGNFSTWCSSCAFHQNETKFDRSIDHSMANWCASLDLP